MWKCYALLSALFAALTSVFAKMGVRGINSDLATAIRTSVVLMLTWGIVLFGPHMREIRSIPGHAWILLVVSGCFISRPCSLATFPVWFRWIS